MKNKKSYEMKYLRWQIIIAALTPFIAIIVVHYQLSLEHDFWFEQRKQIREEKVYDQKITRIEKLTSLFNQLIDSYHEGFIMNVYLSLDMAHVFTGGKVKLDRYQNNIERQHKTLTQFQKLQREIVSILGTNEFVFNKHIKELSNKIVPELYKLDFQKRNTENEIIDYVKDLKGQGKRIDEIINNVSDKFAYREYNPVYQQFQKLLDAMYDNISTTQNKE